MYVVAIVLALPDQSTLEAGIEMLVVAAGAGVGLQLLDRRARGSRSTAPIAGALEEVSPNTITCVLLAAGAIRMVFNVATGPYIVALATVVAITGGIASAWLFLTRIT